MQFLFTLLFFTGLAGGDREIAQRAQLERDHG